MAKTLTQLIVESREIIGQTDENQSNITNTQITRWLNEGYLRAVAKLKRSGTPNTISTYNVTGATVTLNTTTLAVKRARFYDSVAGKWEHLDIRDREWFLDNYPDYENDTSGKPVILVHEAGHNDVRLHPSPSAAYQASSVLKVDSVDSPTEMSAGSDTPDLPDSLHMALPHFAAYRGYDFIADKDNANREFAIFTADIKDKAALIAKLGIQNSRWRFTETDD
jgi:hypothetical protein